MLTIIGGIVQLILLLLSKWIQTDAAKKAKQEVVIKELKDAIAKGDTGAITSALSGIK